MPTNTKLTSHQHPAQAGKRQPMHKSASGVTHALETARKVRVELHFIDFFLLFLFLSVLHQKALTKSPAAILGNWTPASPSPTHLPQQVLDRLGRGAMPVGGWVRLACISRREELVGWVLRQDERMHSASLTAFGMFIPIPYLLSFHCPRRRAGMFRSKSLP